MRCSCEQPASLYGCVCETCGGYLEGVQVRRIEPGTPEHQRIMDDWHRMGRPRRIIDPERHSARGDTGQGAPPIPPTDSEAPHHDVGKDIRNAAAAIGRVDSDTQLD